MRAECFPICFLLRQEVTLCARCLRPPPPRRVSLLARPASSRSTAISPDERSLHALPVPPESLPAQIFAERQSAGQRRPLCRFSCRGKARHARPGQRTHKHGVCYLAALEAGGKQRKIFRLFAIRGQQGLDTETFRRGRRAPFKPTLL